MTDYLKIEYETTLRDIDAALQEFHIELPTGGAVHRDHGVHLLVEQLRRAEAEVERLQTERRWISVTERLPERDAEYPVSETVLVFVLDLEFGDIASFMDISTYHFELEQWLTAESDITHEDFNRTVTHWMPLPKLPEAVE